MSVVTNIILSFSTLEVKEERIKDVNSFPYNNSTLNLVSIDFNKDKENGIVWYGGNKFFESNVYLGAFNHFDMQNFLTHIKQITWAAPELVQLIVKEDEDDKFRILEII